MEDRQDKMLRQARSRRLRFRVLSVDADDAEVQDFIRRLTEPDDAYAQRQLTDRPEDASAEPPRVDLRW